MRATYYAAWEFCILFMGLGSVYMSVHAAIATRSPLPRHGKLRIGFLFVVAFAVHKFEI